MLLLRNKGNNIKLSCYINEIQDHHMFNNTSHLLYLKNLKCPNHVLTCDNY